MPQPFTGMQGPQAGQHPGMQGQNPNVGVTGMANAPAQPQQGQTELPDFNDPSVIKEWREKIANNPVTGLRDFISVMIRAEGAPLLEQFRSQITSQLSPIQQQFVGQQINSYAQQRAQDPSFAAIQPVFQQLAQRAVQQGYQLTPQVLSTIEHIATLQAPQMGVQVPQPQAQQQHAPFTERPGSGGQGFPQQEQPTLSPEQKMMAQRFGMSPAQYAAKLREIG